MTDEEKKRQEESAQRFVDLVTMAPKWVQCEACEGAGEVFVILGYMMEGYEPCKKCNGKGEVLG